MSGLSKISINARVINDGSPVVLGTYKGIQVIKKNSNGGDDDN